MSWQRAIWVVGTNISVVIYLHSNLLHIYYFAKSFQVLYQFALKFSEFISLFVRWYKHQKYEIHFEIIVYLK